MEEMQPKTATWFYVLSTTKGSTGTVVPQNYWHQFIQIESIRERKQQIADDPIFQALVNNQCLKILVPSGCIPTPTSIQSFIDGIHTPDVVIENPSDNDLLIYRMMATPTHLD